MKTEVLGIPLTFANDRCKFIYSHVLTDSDQFNLDMDVIKLVYKQILNGYSLSDIECRVCRTKGDHNTIHVKVQTFHTISDTINVMAAPHMEPHYTKEFNQNILDLSNMQI